MDSSDEFRNGRIGSLELNGRAGPNLLRGLLVATLIHGGVIATPGLLREFFGIWTLPPVEVETEYPDGVTFIIPPPIGTHVRPEPPAPPPVVPEFAIPVAVATPTEVDTTVIPDQADIPPAQPHFDPIESGTDGGGGESGAGYLAGHFDVVPSIEIWIPREVEPKLLSSNPQPDFPEMAKRARINGTVHIKVFVDRHGDVRRYQIVKENPSELGFGEEVLKVIPRWKFTPALQQNEPVGVWVTFPFKFEIK